MENQNNATVTVAPLSLPKGNGTTSGMGGTLSGFGPDGMMSLSLPLPLFAGRGDAPALSLRYNSGSGNGPFGMGWSCAVMSIARRTSRGVPRWQDDDEFIGPDGEVLLPDSGPVTRTELRGQPLPECTVRRYLPRIERTQFIIERWIPVKTPAESFWIVYTPDGGLHCMGKTAQARITHPQVAGGTAVWLLEESVNALGEHQYWQYKAEDNVNCGVQEVNPHPLATAQRYLSQVFYGNISASDVPFVLHGTLVLADWLFCLTFDFGEYGDADTVPFVPTGQWASRADCFSDYQYGFDLRTRRLCHQVLMFHRLHALAGQPESIPEMTLCGRMSLYYDESAVVTTLVSVIQHATGSDKPASLPPLEFDWQEPMSVADIVWSPVTDMANLNHLQPWQLVDLYGEGIPGILYQDNKSWLYRAPVRKPGGGITWSAPSPLHTAPATDGHNLLMDITRDGRPDWVVTRPGMQGYFTLDASNNWSSFIPLTALPTEFFHPSAQLQDLTGKGNPDLVLIGPGSVRLWGANDSGWESAHDVTYTGASSLPTTGHDARSAVVFSDLLGSGQQHIAKIQSDSVTVWPSLGNGQFGEAMSLPGFNVPVDEFSPSRVYLADTDGSGSTDILYVQSDRILVFLNQSGNRFIATDSPIMFPDGVRFDDSCQIQFADLQGQGVTSVLLTVPHPQVQHWCCHLNTEKPWLLTAMNNNMGTHNTFKYRSSAQFWLDEKKSSVAAVCRLPFPVHTLWQQTTEDEITGSKLISEARYYQGVWDAREREMRGFACVEQQDSILSLNTLTDAAPLLTRTWYATGVEAVDSELSSDYWSDDDMMFPTFTPHMTAWQGNKDVPLAQPASDERWWLQRAFRGCMLRSEIYGLDQNVIPFSVTESRWQARRLSAHSALVPQVMPVQLETRSYVYERRAADPLISQTVNLMFDAEGIPVDTLTINYPRRTGVAESYRSTLMPESIAGDSIDDQQQNIYFTRVRSTVFSFRKNDVWRVGLPNKQRTDVSRQQAAQCPDSGFSLEILTAGNGIMSTPEAQGAIDKWFEKGDWTFAGLQQVRYTISRGDTPLNDEPEVQALIAFTESAVLDNSVFSLTSAYNIDETELTNWGYFKTVDTKTEDTKASLVIWGARVGYTDYGETAQFWRPIAQRPSLLLGQTQIGWDTHICFPVRQTDAAGLTTSVQIDYRFMQAVQMTDINDNHHQIILDDFGRPIASRFNGTEEGKPVGYSPWSNSLFPLNISVTDALLAITAQTVPLASFSIIAADSWMQNVSEAPTATFAGLISRLTTCGAISQGGRLHTQAWLRYQRRHSADTDVPAMKTWLKTQNSRVPPHQLDVTTDRYDTDTEQKRKQTIRFSDGMGHPLQVSVRHEDGIPEWCWMQTGLVKSDGKTTSTRWAVSGRTEYNNKGLPVRTYQPFFLNDWRYVSDDSARKEIELYADTFFYDAAGRNTKTLTAKGYLRRTQYYPWFTVSEDENDTVGEVTPPSVS